MIRALFLSFGQLLDSRVALVFVKSILLTVIVFTAAGLGIWFGMHRAATAWLEGWSWGSQFADIATIVLFGLAALWLFRAIAVAVIGIFADEVVMAVEARHYPGALAQSRKVPLARELAMGLGSVTRLIVINILLSPVYIMLLITGVGTPIVFFLVNSWLLGRDFGDMVAARHMPASDLRKWRTRTRFRRFSIGAFGTALFLVPGLNLIAPILGAAMAAHAFHQGRK